MTKDTEEHDPLLGNSGNHGRTSSTNSNDDDNHTMDQELGLADSVTYSVPSPVVNQKSYGTTEGPTRRSDLIYSWSDVNVFAADTSSSNGSWIFDCFKKNGERPPKKQKQILKNVNGEACPGELLAILGSSGAGKTTLLNALTFRSTKGVIVGGARSLGGRPLNATYLTSLSAYVQQDDMFIGTLTVKEHLTFQSLVRMDRSVSRVQRNRRVKEVISELALTKCQNTIIGIPGRMKGISGGEMKRLSFASEILTDPPLMFCDEPTSGLDSFMAQNVIHVLKGLAQKGKTVICTIHQPSSELYSMFDKLLLMAEGRVAFLGTPEQASSFFSELGAPCPVNYNPADYYVQLLAVIPGQEETSKQNIESICDNFQKSNLGIKLELQSETFPKKHLDWSLDNDWTGTQRIGQKYRVSWFAQFRAVFWRSWMSVIKEPMLIKVRILQTILVALLIGIIYFGQRLDQDGVMNINGAVFIFITNMTFQNIFAVINVFCAELPIFMRENMSGLYRTDVYFLCKTLAEFPIFTFCPMIFTAIAYYMVGMNPEPSRFLIATGIIMLVTNVATSFGYMISCASKSVSMALSMGPPLIIPFMLFGGFFLNSGSVPIYFEWLSKLSWFKYGNEALMINQWEGVDKIDCNRSNATCPQSGEIVLQTLNFSQSDFTMDIVCLVLLIFGFRLLAYLALLARTYRKE